MNEELQKKLLQYLNGLEGIAKDAALFGKAEIPEFMKELIQWEIYSHAINVFAMAVLVAGSVWAIMFWWKREWYKEDFSPVVMLPAISLLIGGVFLFMEIQDIAKPILAPRIFLVEKLSSMVRK